ncbi:SH3 domain-containing protein [Pelistega sp. MC2]|uniref:SH3 domain-containing protein n=1 Tax=Pelistega sp. MC2 TaxID=1720297 RepID=UPI0008DA06FD|nr:SH3 domain-containing protein [Pelistega sp. MC2]
MGMFETQGDYRGNNYYRSSRDQYRNLHKTSITIAPIMSLMSYCGRYLSMIGLFCVLSACSTISEENAAHQAVNEVELYPINQTYYLKKTAHLRSAPDKASASLGYVNRGTSIYALGHTGTGWIAVGRDGAVIGYVFADLVSQTKVSSAGRVSNTATLSPQVTESGKPKQSQQRENQHSLSQQADKSTIRKEEGTQTRNYIDLDRLSIEKDNRIGGRGEIDLDGVGG